MQYFSSVLSSMLSTIFIVFLIMTLGLLLGRIEIKGISLGTAGVIVVALIYGIVASFYPVLQLGSKNIVLFLSSSLTLNNGTVLSATKPLFSLISNIGTALFVTAVGLIAGPKFFRSFNKSSVGYIVVGVVVIMSGVAVALLALMLSSDSNLNASLVSGLLTGALTSTPGLSAAKEIAAEEAKVTAGYGIAYLFGVLGVVFFVQIMPKLLKVDIAKERDSYIAANQIEIPAVSRKLVEVDAHGFFPFALTIVFGCIIGAIKIPGINFSLGTSGGTLVAGLIIGHYSHIGSLDCHISKSSLTFFRELGLCLFLIGAGVPGGVNFISNLKASYFLYGALITLIPMFVGYFIAVKGFKMSLFNAMGSITGGMTSTPALGSLIATAGTDEVTSAYAATYPVALVCVVLAARIIALIF